MVDSVDLTVLAMSVVLLLASKAMGCVIPVTFNLTLTPVFSGTTCRRRCRADDALDVCPCYGSLAVRMCVDESYRVPSLLMRAMAPVAGHPFRDDRSLDRVLCTVCLLCLSSGTMTAGALCVVDVLLRWLGAVRDGVLLTRVVGAVPGAWLLALLAVFAVLVLFALLSLLWSSATALDAAFVAVAIRLALVSH